MRERSRMATNRVVLAVLLFAATGAAFSQANRNPLQGGAQPAAEEGSRENSPEATRPSAAAPQEQAAPLAQTSAPSVDLSQSSPAQADTSQLPPGAQTAPPAPGGGPALKLNPLEAMRQFQPTADEEYRLGKGDEITVDFIGRPEMQARLVVGPDGRVTLPLAGDLILNGLSRPESARAIEKAMSVYYTNLTAQVTVTKYTSNHVMLLGAVDHPGLINFDGTPTLLEVLTRGGLTVGTDTLGKVRPMPAQCAIYRGENQVLWVQLQELLTTGNSMANLRLRRDDVVYVPSAADQSVSVLGEVQRPGPVAVGQRTPLIQVLTQVGGTTDKAGGNPKIVIADPKTGATQTVSLKELLDPRKTLEYNLHPGQIVYVGRSGFYAATYVLERLSPLVSMGTFAAFIGMGNR